MNSPLRLAFAGLLALSLISSGCDSDSGTDTCGLTVTATSPAAGATVAPGAVEIVFSLSGADASTPSVALTKGGATVEGTSMISADQTKVTFTPSAALEADSAYHAALTFCGGTSTLDFTTGAGVSLDIVDNTYVIDLSESTFVEPAGVGTLIAASLTLPVFLKVTKIEGNSMDMLGAVGLEGTTDQNLCYETFEMHADISDAPSFSVTSDESSVSLAGVAVTLYDIDISGTFSDDGASFDQATMAFTLDVRDVVDVLDGLDTWQDICAYTDSLDAPCLTCASDSVDACLYLKAEDIVGDPLTEGAIVPITAAEVAANSACAEE